MLHYENTIRVFKITDIEEYQWNDDGFLNTSSLETAESWSKHLGVIETAVYDEDGIEIARFRNDS